MRVPDHGGSIFQCTSLLQAVSLTLTILVLMFLFIKPKVLFALDVMWSMWELHDRPLDMSTPSTSHKKQPPGHDHAVCMKILKFS